MNSDTPNPSNQCDLDYKDNADLKDAFASKEVGDKVTFTVEAQIISKDDEHVVMTMESVEVEGYTNPNAQEGEEPGEVEPTAQEPVMMAMQSSTKDQDNGE